MSFDYHECKCGQSYVVYVPYKLILEESKKPIPETIRVVGEIDEIERKSRKMEEWKRFAENKGAEFVDIRVDRVIKCKCKRIYDPLSFLSS